MLTKTNNLTFYKTLPAQQSFYKSTKSKGHGQKALWIIKNSHKVWFNDYMDKNKANCIQYIHPQIKFKEKLWQLTVEIFFKKTDIKYFHDIMKEEILTNKYDDYKHSDFRKKALNEKFKLFEKKYEDFSDLEWISTKMSIQPNKWEKKKQWQLNIDIHNDFVYYFTANYLSKVCITFNTQKQKWFYQPQIDYNYIRQNYFYLTKQKDGKSSLRPYQKYFRTAVIKKFHNQCAITKIDYADVLEACHIKPVHALKKKPHKITDETINPDNGILLTRNLHKLFDEGVFTFNQDGKIRFSEEFIHENYYEYLHTTNKISDVIVDFNEKSQSFLDYHRSLIFRDIIL